MLSVQFRYRNSKMKITAKPVKNKTYSLFSKAEIAIEAYASPRNVKPTARKFNLQPKQIRDWVKKGIVEKYRRHFIRINAVHTETAAVRANNMVDFDAIEEELDELQVALDRQEYLKGRKRLACAYRMKGGGRKTMTGLQTKQQLKGFFMDMRKDDLPVDMAMFIAQANVIDPLCMVNVSLDAFRQRMNRLLKDWGGSYRLATHKAQIKKMHPKTMNEFQAYIKLKCQLLDIPKDAVFNFDETNVYFSPHVSYSWSGKGQNTINLREIKSSYRCTAMLGSSMTGNRVVPFLIYTGANTRNGKIKKILENAEENGYPSGLEYTVQANGWMDEVAMLDWISKVWKPVSQAYPATMLVLDSFTAHLTGPVMLALSLCNTEVEIIPAGFTSKLQPMDVGVNKPFKGKVRSCFTKWMVANRMRADPKEKPNRITVATWIKTAWSDIEQRTFINSFYGSGFDIEKVEGPELPVAELDIEDNDNENDGPVNEAPLIETEIDALGDAIDVLALL